MFVFLSVCLWTLQCPANYSSSFDAMGYPRVPMASLWPNGGNKPNWGKIWAKKYFFFKKILYVIPSALLSFLPYYCHSFRIIVIPSRLLSFLPDHCHSFQIIVISSVLVSLFSNIVIPSKLFGDLQIPTSSKTFPSPKDEKNGHICEFK